MKKLLFSSIFFVTLLSAHPTAKAADIKINVSAEGKIVYDKGQLLIDYQLKNTSRKNVEIDEIGINSSPIWKRSPNGQVFDFSIIAEYGGNATFFRKPEEILHLRKPVYEDLNSEGLYTGLYQFRLIERRSGAASEIISIYREELMPKIQQGRSIDDFFFVDSLLKRKEYERFQSTYRQGQIAATEGTKQYLFAHPYTMALSADGEPGLRVKLMATNNTQQELTLTSFDTQNNRIEVEGPRPKQVLSFPGYPMNPDKERREKLEVGQTKSWYADIGTYLEANRISSSGRYTCHWYVDEKEVASFVFYLPEKETEQEPKTSPKTSPAPLAVTPNLGQ